MALFMSKILSEISHIGPFFCSFSRNSFVLNSFWARELSNRRSSCTLPNDGKTVNQISMEFSCGFGQTLVKPVQILLSLKCSLGLTDFNKFGYFQPVLALIGLPQFACRIPEKILSVKMGLWQLPILCVMFRGTWNVRQRNNDSVLIRSDFLDLCAHCQ